MRVFFPVIFSLVCLAIISAIELFLLKKLHRDWWNYKIVRIIGRSVPFAGLFFLTLWVVGIFTNIDLMLSIGAFSSAAVLVIGLALILSLPLSGVIHWFAHTFKRSKAERKKVKHQPEPSERRRFLKTASIVIPAITVTAGSSGLASSFRDPLTPEIPLWYPNLPTDLEGFRIVHITDVHVGLFITMYDFERMVEVASRLRGNLVLITGDFSDDASTYYDSLMLASQIPNTHGAYACIGNHEYFRGIRNIFKAYERSPIPLLLNSGTTIRVNNTDIYLAGADDPRSLGKSTPEFFGSTIDKALDGAPSDAFHLVMSHRPEGFDAAAQRGIDLTLAGHTHGGQIGFNRRSVMEQITGKDYMWGLYEQGNSKLYTSAGAGHWFPFRLGCPAEIPVYVLTSKQPTSYAVL